MTVASYRPEIDGLRAIAVLAVIVNHFGGSLLSGGYLGVDIFFVISGYVITCSLVASEHSSFKDFILGFYSRRARRLLPALIVCVVVTSLVGLLFISPADQLFRTIWKTGATALVGFSNIRLYRDATDYFGVSSEFNLFTQTWSLGVEEQFYLLYPLLVWWVVTFRRKGLGDAIPLLIVCVLCVASLLKFIHWNEVKQAKAYFLVQARFWELGLGCLVSFASEKYPAIRQSARDEIGLVLLGLLILTLFSPLQCQVYATAVAVVATALLIGLMSTNGLVFRFLTWTPMVFIGLSSYSLYLWHWSVLTIGRWTVGVNAWSAPLMLVAVGFLAWVSFKKIETPLRKFRPAAPYVRILGSSYGLALCVAALLLVCGDRKFSGLYLGEEAAAFTLQKADSSHILAAAEQSSKLVAAQIEAADRLQLDCNMTPHHLVGKHYRAMPILDDDFFRKCLYGTERKIVLVGDSFSQIMVPYVALAASTIGYDFRTLFGYDCPYPLTKHNIDNHTDGKCEIDSARLQRALAEYLMPGDILVLRLYFSAPVYIEFTDSKYIGEFGDYDREILNLYRLTRAKGASLHVIGSNQVAKFQPPACLNPQWFNYLQTRSGNCDVIKLNDSPQNLFTLAHNNHLSSLEPDDRDHFSVVDPITFVCASGNMNCPVRDADHVYMFDDHHLAQAAIDKFYPAMLSELQRLAVVYDPGPRANAEPL